MAAAAAPAQASDSSPSRGEELANAEYDPEKAARIAKYQKLGGVSMLPGTTCQFCP